VAAWALAVAWALGGCVVGGEGAQARLLTLEAEVEEGVEQYVSLLCGCFAPADEETQAQCSEERALRFPTSACDQEMVRLDEAAGEAFLFCLQLDINRASACLIGCDSALIRQCQATFSSVDTLACRAELTDAQRAALRECGRAREALRRTPP
jgi:hypothetical protein